MQRPLAILRSVCLRPYSTIALLLLVSMVLAACPAPAPPSSGAPAASTGSTGEGGTVTTEDGIPLNTSVSGEVEFWHFWGSPVRRTAIRRIVAMCQEKLPNIQVTEVFKPWGDIWTANVAAVAAGSGMPDVIVSDRPTLPQSAADQVYQSLQAMAERDGIDGSRFWDFAWQQTLYEDETYGIPFETDVRLLFWNKNAFREAGLDPETPPETWDEVWEYADALDQQNEDGSYSRIAFFPLWRASLQILGFTNDVVWVTDNGEPQVNSPEAIETMTWVKQWVDRYGGYQNLQNFEAQFSAPPNDLFMSGALPMMIDVAGYMSILNFYRPNYTTADGTTEPLEWGIANMPYNTDPGNWSGGFSLSIPVGAENPEAAWEFIKCATSHEGHLSWARDTAAIPTHREAAADPILLADPNWEVVLSAMETSSGGNYLAAYPNWFEQIQTRQEQVWNGELTPEEALEQAQQEIERLMAQQ